jgi:hypothetical protein
MKALGIFLLVCFALPWPWELHPWYHIVEHSTDVLLSAFWGAVLFYEFSKKEQSR